MHLAARRVATWIAAHEFWLLLVYGLPLLLASNLPRYALALALATIPLFWLARRLALGKWSKATPLDLPFLLLGLLGILSIAISTDRATSMEFYAEAVGMAGLYYGIVNSLTPGRVASAVWIVLALDVVMAVLGLVGLRYPEKFLTSPFLYSFLPKLDLSFLNGRGFTPNIVAGAIAPAIPLACAWAFTQPRIGRVLAGSVALLALSVVFLTQSRGALLGVVMALLVILFGRLPHLSWSLLLAPALLAAALLVLGPTHLLNAILASDSSGSAASRLELWARALNIFQDFPFTGIVLGTFQQVVPQLYPLFLSDPSAPLPHAHNLYLQVGVDYGIGGLVAFLGMVTSALVIGLRNVWRTRGKSENWLALGLLAGLVAVLTHGLLDAVLLSTKVGFGFWSMLGLMIALTRINQSSVLAARVTAPVLLTPSER